MLRPIKVVTLSCVIFFGGTLVCSESTESLLSVRLKSPDQELIEILIERGADLIELNEGNPYSPLHIAINSPSERRSYSILDYLIMNSKQNTEVPLKNSAIAQAAFDGGSAAVSAQIQDRPTLVNEPGLKGGTALFWAACNGKVDEVKLLLSCKEVDVNASNERGETPLTVASKYGHEQVVELLLHDKRVQINKQDIFGETALHCAMLILDDAKRERLKNLLIQAGADTELTNKQGRKAAAERF